MTQTIFAPFPPLLPFRRRYLLLLPASFLFGAVLWHLAVEDVLYYCSDRAPILDFFPPFVHPTAGDYFIAFPALVDFVWYAFTFGILLLPLWASIANQRWPRITVGLLGLSSLLFVVGLVVTV